MHRAKILAELKKKFPGLSVEFLGLIAIQLESKVTEESQIEGVVTGLDNSPIAIPVLAADFQKEGDKRVTAAQKKWKEENPANPELPKPEPIPNPPKPEDANSQLLKAISDLRTEVTTMRQRESQKTLSEKLATKVLEKKIPARFLKGRTVEKEEDLDTVVAEIEQDFNDTKQEFINEGLGNSTTPSSGITTTKSTTVDADITAWANKGKDTAKK